MTAAPTPSSLLNTLGAVSRPAGSSAEGEAREVCSNYLGQRGFLCQEKRFTYSAWPGRWATPACGALLFIGATILVIREFPKLGFSGTILGSLSLAILFLLLAITFGVISAYFGTPSFPWLRTTSINLEAVRNPTIPPHAIETHTPPIWLVAHLDSKSQPIPMALRVAAITTSIVAWITLLILWIVALSSQESPLHLAFPYIVLTIAFLAMLAAIPLALCTIIHKGTGALDNATGVATILSAIDQIDPQIPIGVLLTSAEELGLAGARAWVRARQQSHLLEYQVQRIHAAPVSRTTPMYLDQSQLSRYSASNSSGAGPFVPPPVFLNCDSVDDRGTLTCMFPRRYVDFFQKPIQNATETVQIPVKCRRLVPGILVDAVAFTKAGWPALTVSRGDWKSLARIHSRDDTLEHVTGSGIESAAQFMATLVHAIAARSQDRVGSPVVSSSVVL